MLNNCTNCAFANRYHNNFICDLKKSEYYDKKVNMYDICVFWSHINTSKIKFKIMSRSTGEIIEYEYKGIRKRDAINKAIKRVRCRKIIEQDIINGFTPSFDCYRIYY